MPLHDEQQLIRWVPQLRRYARALLRHREDADDLVQDTLERALVKSAHWPGVSNMRAWLFSLMHNRYVDGVRRPQVAVSAWDDDEVAQVPAMPAPGTALLDLETALHRLPPEQKEVLLLVVVEEMTYAEVAEALGIPLGTVMSRLSRGRERLRSWMEGDPQPARLKVVK